VSCAGYSDGKVASGREMGRPMRGKEGTQASMAGVEGKGVWLAQSQFGRARGGREFFVQVLAGRTPARMDDRVRIRGAMRQGRVGSRRASRTTSYAIQME
jgi:hypothetical protein